MSSTAIAILTQMLEPLPETTQERVVEHLREYLLDVEDDHAWDARFKSSQPELVAAAQRARQEIAEVQSQPLGSGIDRGLF